MYRDSYLIQTIGLEYHEWREPEGYLRFALGCRIGELSGQLIPMGELERRRIEEEDRLFMAEYEASRIVPMVATH